MEAALQRAGHTVVAAASGEEALAKYKADGAFDVVVTDVLMPEMDGLALITALRKQAPDQRILAISGAGLDSSDEFLGPAKRLGASEVLEKPFMPDRLIAVVARMLGAPEARPRV